MNNEKSAHTHPTSKMALMLMMCVALAFSLVSVAPLANALPTVSINDGFIYTTNRNVHLDCTWDWVGIDVRYSNDQMSWTAPAGAVAIKPWTLSTGDFYNSYGDGEKTVFYEIKPYWIPDAEWIKCYDTIILDTTNPTGSIKINNNLAYTTSQTVTLQLTYGDVTSGVYQVWFSNDGKSWSYQAPVSTKSWTLTAGGGTKTVYYMVEDRTHLSSTYTDTIIYDPENPTGSISINNGAVYTTSTSVTLNLSYADVTSGVSQVRYQNALGSWSAWEPPSATKAWTLPSGAGNKVVSYQIIDRAGRTSQYSDSIAYDLAAPTGSILINSGATYTSSTAVTLALSYSDDASGVKQVRFRNNLEAWGVWLTPSATIPWTLVPGKAVYCQFIDNAGRVSAEYSDSIIYDGVPPTGSVVINGGATYSASIAVTLTLTYADATSGVKDVRYSNDGVWDTEIFEAAAGTRAWTLLAPEGTKTVWYQVRDNAGRTAMFSDTIKLDTSGPTGSIQINGGAASTTSTSVTLTLAYGDTVSGASQVRYQNMAGAWSAWEPPAVTKAWTLPAVAGNKFVYYEVKNGAGLVSQFSDSINYSPVVTGTLTVTSPNGGQSWVRGTSRTLTWMSSGSPGANVKIELLKAGVANLVISASTANDGTYSWTIPAAQTLGTDYKIRITSTTDASIVDTSNSNFTIVVGSLTVTAPNGGESWIHGTTHTITWTSSGSPGSNVKIELLKAGAVNLVISASTANDGSYSWTIPAAQATGTDYKIRVTSTTNAAITDSSDNNFAITVGALTVTAPNGGESWVHGTAHTITWTSLGNPGVNVKIELLKGGVVNRVISSSTANNGSFSWTISATQTVGTDYTIRITSTTNAAITDLSNSNFAIVT